jgi:hypothetical protein
MSRLHSPLWPDHRVKPPYGSVEVDWEHPLAQGLRLYTPINNGAGIPSLLTPGNLAVVGSSMLWGNSPKGLAVVGNSAKAYSLASPFTATPFTLAAWFRVAADGTAMTPISLANNGSASQFQELMCGMATAGDPLRVLTYDGGLAEAQVGTIVVNTDYFGAGVWGAANSRFGYLNGVVGTAETSSKIPSGLNTLGVGGLTTSTPERHMNGNVYGAAAWSRALSVNELHWLHSDPYCFLREVKKRSYGFVGAAAGGSFKAFWTRRRSGLLTPGVM